MKKLLKIITLLALVFGLSISQAAAESIENWASVGN